MFYKKKIRELDNRIKHLEQILTATSKFMEQYLNEHNVDLALDHLFSMDSPIEDIYCFMKSIDGRIKRIEKKRTIKRQKKES